MFAGVDLLRLFKYAADNRVNFFTTQIENIIRDSLPKLLLG